MPLDTTISTVFRLESPRIIARLVRMVGDVGEAEDLAQDALLAALRQWPEEGIPDNPGAWLMTAARRRALDLVRRRRMLDARHAQLGHELDASTPDTEERLAEALDDDVGDDMLRLMFTACHPVLPAEARVALTLRLVGGLTTEEIARAFLVPTATLAQRIVRAKQALAEAGVPYEVPRGAELMERLDTVLGVVYLVFNEGYAATAGDDLLRPALCDDAMRLGRVLAGLMPGEPEVFGLVALMELQASRFGARTDRDGNPVLLMDQDRTRWNRLLITRGLAALARAAELGGRRGSYALQAAIAACHATAPTAADTDWERIASLYAELAVVLPSPVVELNRAVAVGMARGPAEGLALADRLGGDKRIRSYHLYPSVRAHFLEQLGRADEARAEYARAADMTRNARERQVLMAKADGRAAGEPVEGTATG